ncbi:MAG: aspartate kinase [Deferribacteraceae bacterium]|jgi:aspartate kinase|nr:aspartate kinase [Deferribacteraceae bacterium]
MGIVVMKFGGTSVANVERIQNVAAKVVAKRNAGNKVVVVASAMAGVTDKLINMLKELTTDYDLREYDQMVSTGETSNVPLLAQAIKQLGVPAMSFTGTQAGIETDNKYSKARISKIETKRLEAALDSGMVCVVAGFQGYCPESGDVTTLGRGGSDTTAVALAAALHADVCEIYTDVDGVYTADPRNVRHAKKLDVISHEEMLELSSLGAKVLVSRCVELGMNYNVDIMVLSSLEDKPGTLVTSKMGAKMAKMEKIAVSGVTSDKNQAKITLRDLPDRPGVAAEVFSALGGTNINVDMIIQNFGVDGIANISFTVSKTELPAALKTCNALAKTLGSLKIETDEDIAKVSIVGIGMKSHSGVAATMFKSLSDNNINILMISTSEIKISCIIEEKFAELAVRVLHDAFIDHGDNIG